MKKVSNNLYEYMETIHLKQRIEERVFNIKDVNIPGIQINDAIKNNLKRKISLGVKSRIETIRNKTFPYDKAIAYKLIIPVVIYKGKKSIPEIITESKDNNGEMKEYPGSLFVINIIQNKGTTIMNMDEKSGDGFLISKTKGAMLGNNKVLDVMVESYPKIYYEIDLDKEEIKYAEIQKSEESNLGAVSSQQFERINDFNSKNEKSIDVLNNFLSFTELFLEKNKDRLNSTELSNIKNKINLVKVRIDYLKKVPEKAALNIAQKGSYRKGTPYNHKDFGKGIIQSVEKVGDGFYNIIVQFKQPFGLKKVRVKEKEKPEAVASGLYENLRERIRQILTSDYR